MKQILYVIFLLVILLVLYKIKVRVIHVKGKKEKKNSLNAPETLQNWGVSNTHGGSAYLF